MGSKSPESLFLWAIHAELNIDAESVLEHA